MKASVRGEVGFDVSVAVGGVLNLVAGLVDGVGHEAVLVVFEILLDGGPEEVVVLGVVACSGVYFAGKVACKDLFLEAVEGVRDALEIFEIGHCVGDGGILRARGEDGAACGCPVSGRNVGSEPFVSLLSWVKSTLMFLTVWGT